MPRLPRTWWNRARRLVRGRGLQVWYHESFRLPMSSIEARAGIDPRRADLVAWFLLDEGLLAQASLRAPERLPLTDLARVHTPAYLESLAEPEVLARIFGVEPWDIAVDELLGGMRRACGATLAAARAALGGEGPQLNLLGGFHHAFPAKGGGLCTHNDIATAIAALRAEGFAGRVVVLDLDAHPPDGTAACLASDPDAWIGSLSGSDWGPLVGVDETVLPEGSDDTTYLTALNALLGRMPRPALVFVLAGGDVLAGDRLGRLGLTLEGARRRDLAVIQALEGVPAVWLPGGGYQKEQGWRALAGTAMALEVGSAAPIPTEHDPMRLRYHRIARGLGAAQLGGPPPPKDEPFITGAELDEALGMRRSEGSPRLLGYYSAEGLELALWTYGFLPHLRRLGYDRFQVGIDRASAGERLRLSGDHGGERCLLLESVLERVTLDRDPMLYVNWLSLRDPRASFSALRPRLPGQEFPGLGLAREAGQLLARMARRLELKGVAFRPAWFHVAYTARHHFRFLDPGVQGRFEALVRDLGHLPLLTVTTAVAEGRVRCRGLPFTWEPGAMAYRFAPPSAFDAAVIAHRDQAEFTLAAPP
ncbi:MAG: histone deacetylase [Pseudomonadota bacterium]